MFAEIKELYDELKEMGMDYEKEDRLKVAIELHRNCLLSEINTSLKSIQEEINFQCTEINESLYRGFVLSDHFPVGLEAIAMQLGMK